MTNEEMMRPCTLWGETFDACDVLKLSTSYVRANRHHVFIGGEWVSSPTETGRYVVVSTTSRRYFSPLVKTGEERQALLLEAIRTIADALNAPIKVTQAVLDAMKKQAVESKLLGGNVAHYKRYSDHGAWFSFYLWDVDMGWWCGYHNSYYTDEDLLMDYVQADSDCPLALQVLLGFTVEGVPKDD
jgi:hypothetical protein